MKYWKRILPLLLVLAMLAGYMVPVAAQEVEATLSLNETVSVTVSWEHPLWFAFVPEADGYYAFISTDHNDDPYGEVYDSDLNLLSANDDGGEGLGFVAKWWATAGETYYLKATGWGSYNVQLQIPGDAEAVALFAEDSVLTVGKTTGMWVEFYPSYCFLEDVTFSSSDETVATVDQHGTVLAVSAGAAVITVTSEKGLTDVWYITVEAPPAITCDEDITVILDQCDTEYLFIPETDGWYGVYSVTDWEQYPNLEPFVRIEDADNDLVLQGSLDGLNDEFFEKVYFSAGDAYYFRFDSGYHDHGESYIARIVPLLEAPTGLEILEQDVQLEEGQEVQLHTVTTPAMAWDEAATFTSNDNTVAVVDQYGRVYGVTAGTATITATSESGLTATCTVTVTERPVIELNQIIDLDAADGTVRFTFIPPESGWYAFCSMGDGTDPFGKIYNEVGHELTDNDDGGEGANFFASAFLDEGAIYILQTQTYGNDGSYQVQVLKLTEATGLELFTENLSEGELTGYVSDQGRISYSLVPAASIPQTVTFTTSDESVVQVSEDGSYRLVAAGTATVTATSESGLTATCTVTVNQRPVMELDQVIDLDAADGELRYAFVPPESGWYAFCSEGQEVDPVGTIYDEDGHELAYNDDGGEWANFCTRAFLEAGVTYLLETRPLSNEGAYQIFIQRIFEPTSLELYGERLSDGELTGFAGDAGWLEAEQLPVASVFQNVTFTSSDESVVTVTEDGYYVLMAAGTATVTATAENGITASCTVKVKGALNLSVESPVTLMESDAEQRLKFIPETTGTYVFYSKGKDVDPDCWLYNEDLQYLGDDWSSGEGSNFRLEYPLVVGEVYYLRVNCGWDDSEDVDAAYTVYVHELEEATGIQLSHTQLTGFPNANYRLQASIIPQHARPEELTWTSSDPSIVEIYDDGWMRLCGEGTAVITVTSESGLTASCTVTSQYPDSAELLQLGQTATVPEELGTSWCEFVPPEDGWYCVTLQFTNEDLHGRFYDDQWNRKWGWEYYDEEENIHRHGLELNAGETYYLGIFIQEEQREGDCTITVEKMQLPTGIELNTTAVTGAVTGYQYLEATVFPEYAIPEITWTSSDDTVATVDESGFLMMRGAGTATVTATTVNGVSATCTVTVSEPPLIAVGDTKTLYVADGRTPFRFIPETDGWYGFYTTGEFGTYGYIQSLAYELDYDIDIMEESNRLVRCRLEAGECYYLTFYAWEDQNPQGSYELHAATLEKAQQILLKSNKMSGYVGDCLYSEYQFQPILSEVEDITWTSSDETVATVNSYGEVECIAPGTAVITVTTESGLTDSVTVRVEAIPQDAEDYGYWGDDLLWQIKDGVLTVTGTGDTYNQPICGDFTRVELPEGLTGLGSYAFEDRSLESLTVPASVTSIGERAFAYTNLSEIRFLGHAPAIGEDAFYDLRVTAYYPANDPTWTEEVRQNYGGNVTWVSYESEDVYGFALEGEVAVGDEGAATLELLMDGDEIASVASSDGKYRFENLAAGTYTLRVTRANHGTREYTVTVAEENVTQDVKIHLMGDIDGNGRVNMGDVLAIYAHVRGTQKFTDDYQLLVSDVNGRGINMGDALAVYAHIRGTQKLY